MVGAREVLAADLAGIRLAPRLVLLLVQLQQGLAAQIGIADGAGKVTELRMRDEDVALVAGLRLERLGAVGTVDVAQLEEEEEKKVSTRNIINHKHKLTWKVS